MERQKEHKKIILGVVGFEYSGISRKGLTAVCLLHLEARTFLIQVAGVRNYHIFWTKRCTLWEAQRF
jgi:hypothetical protein